MPDPHRKVRTLHEVVESAILRKLQNEAPAQGPKRRTLSEHSRSKTNHHGSAGARECGLTNAQFVGTLVPHRAEHVNEVAMTCGIECNNAASSVTMQHRESLLLCVLLYTYCCIEGSRYSLLAEWRHHDNLRFKAFQRFTIYFANAHCLDRNSLMAAECPLPH